MRSWRVNNRLNGTTRTNLIVDTGASYRSSLAPSPKSWVSICTLSSRKLQTANAVVAAPLISLDSIEVGGMKIDNLTAAVQDFSQDESISGLLGLNFLSQFRMDIDMGNQALVLEKVVPSLACLCINPSTKACFPAPSYPWRHGPAR